ncbi:hypothetical protein ACQKKX_05400 [Neorhizobium sp. NPDC001467]|uniref:hypothetical protein n=1 Tax=Neorhizobium sp. NPDC001467 TaxID=3390595 RepID=UPI003CFC1599
MLVLRRVLDQFCEQNQLSLGDPLAIVAAQELLRLWQAGDPTEADLATDLAHLVGQGETMRRAAPAIATG